MDQYLTTYRRDFLWPDLSEFLSSECEYGDPMSKLSGDELALYQSCMHHTQPSDCKYSKHLDFEVSSLFPENGGKFTNTKNREQNFVNPQHETDESDENPWMKPMRVVKPSRKARRVKKPRNRSKPANGEDGYSKAAGESTDDQLFDKTEYQDSISKLGGVIMHNDHQKR